MLRDYCGYTGMFNTECCFSQAAIHLRDSFRLLWEQHVYWTRMVILGITFDLPDLEAATNRLLRNAPDFARVFAHFYGAGIAAEFDRLMRAHLVIAAELVKAAKAGSNEAATDAEKRWYANADEIVYFLNRINPYWRIDRMRTMWYSHLALTKAEAVATLNRDYTRSIEIFDRIEKEAMMMADDFSNGLIWQYHL